MARIAEDSELDQHAQVLDLALSLAADESETVGVPDLTDGRKMGDVSLYPAGQKKAFKEGRAKGRPAARRAWKYDGTETVLTLAYTPDGKSNDGGLSYLSKKHCLCCGDSGFKDYCRKCYNNGCPRCQGANDNGQVIPCYYLRKKDVPFPKNFYGNIDCFLPTCFRRGEFGFQTEPDMVMHAMSRHTREWDAHQASQRASQTSEIERLTAQVNALMTAMVSRGTEPTVTHSIATEAPEAVTVGTPEAPLYVSDKPKPPRRTRGQRRKIKEK